MHDQSMPQVNSNRVSYSFGSLFDRPERVPYGRVAPTGPKVKSQLISCCKLK